MKKLLCAIPAALLLTACSPSVQDYVDDPELLSEALNTCIEAEMDGKEVDGDTCEKAKKAQQELMSSALEGLMD